jgi:DNA polymerase II
MTEITGWLLDLYEELPGAMPRPVGIILWLLGEDGQRYRLLQSFPITFYAAGSPHHIESLLAFLATQPVQAQVEYQEKRDLFQPRPLSVLAMHVQQPFEQQELFRKVSRAFTDLTWYDADLPISLRHAALFGTFPLARCHVTIDGHNRVQQFKVLDTPWQLDPVLPELSIVTLELDADPFHKQPSSLVIRSPQGNCSLPFSSDRALLVNLRSLLNLSPDSHLPGPDLIVTSWGDTWLLPYLLKLSDQLRLPFQLNREPARPVTYRRELSYFSYRQIVYRGQQIHLFGRWHIDRCNAAMWNDYGLEGILETARVTALPVQTAARVSPGTGISSMQITTALRSSILVPWHKQQYEQPKTALDLLHRDLGGLVYQPLVGLHASVGAIDFISMYPGIMVHYNISPETLSPENQSATAPAPPSDPPPKYPTLEAGDGLIPQTLAPLLEKRVALKKRLLLHPHGYANNAVDHARASAQKWLLVTCFGYLGYKNARFGRIEAHEAVTSWGREALLRAKEVAEEQGFTVLHLFVDGLWIQKPGATHPEDFEPVLKIITDRTRLPISLDGVYRWIVFLPSRVDERVPVANRYFGVFQDGSLKVRGIEARRRDSPPFIANLQMEMLHYLAQAPDAARLPEYVTGAIRILRAGLARLRQGQVRLEELLVAQRLSRKLEDYRVPSPAARAAKQLAALGKQLRPGQRVRFLITRGESGVHAWDLPDPPCLAAINLPRYQDLTFEAALTILQPLGIDRPTLRAWIYDTTPFKPVSLFLQAASPVVSCPN